MIRKTATESGILYIVATPIGNLEDISLRASHVLNAVDVILAEDTRHSQQLLTALGIKKPLIALHAHNESNKSASVIADLLNGRSMALISDAGTPLISDPGYPLVKLAHEKQIRVIPIPGPCAFITAVSAAGVACDLLTFAGFLPAKQSARKQTLKSFETLHAHTLIFYESTHRIQDSMKDIEVIFGPNCRVVLAKELTKTFERIFSGSCADIQAWLLTDNAHCKGEFVLIIPPRPAVSEDLKENQRLLSILLKEMPLKQAVKIASQLCHTHKNELYRLALTLRR